MFRIGVWNGTSRAGLMIFFPIAMLNVLGSGTEKAEI